MVNLQSKRSVQQGFTLVEAMIAFAVLAFGLLAIASFQSKLVSGSGYNKARAEAIAIAQQKIEQIRSYVNEPELVANLEGAATPTTTDSFPASVADGDYPAVAETIQGSNAEFSRQWGVSIAGDDAAVTVSVGWDDPSQGPQVVTLETVVTWRNARAIADLSEAGDEPLVPSATGRAYLGDGHVDDTSGGQSNNDGTTQGDFDSDGDLELVDDDTGDVVLTLRDACNVETGDCTDFVRISGYVLIDKAASGKTLSDIYVLASDAAYCARDLVLRTGISGPNGDYDYYFYTCYLGGGWHGNIGLLISGANSNDAACVGDPSADPNDGNHKWRRYELAKRRVYRGMVHKVDSNGDEITNTDGDTLFYSQGVADATQLPDPGWLDRYYYHNFIVTRVTGAGSGGGTASDCLPALTRTDAALSNVFYGNANDFVCLNADNVPNDYATGVDPNSYSPYLDTFHDADVDRARNDCPYDPSDPPSWRFTISGNITTASVPAEMEVLTSDGTDNCRWTILGMTTTYECDIYAWEDADGNINGWDGAIMVTPPDDMVCAKSPVDGSTVYTNPVTWPYFDVINSNNTTEHYTCVELASPVFSGTITAVGSDLTGSTVVAIEDATGEETICEPAISSVTTPNDTATYSCNVNELTLGAGWTGDVIFTPSTDAADVCGVQTWRYTAERNSSSGNDYSCTPTYPHTLDGRLFAAGGVDLTGLTVGVTISGSCETAVAADGASAEYKCVVEEHGAGWSGSVYFTPPVGLACTPASFTRVALGGNETLPDSTCDVPAVGGWLTVSGSVTVSNGADLGLVSVSSSDGLCDFGGDTYKCAVWDDGSGWSGNVIVHSSEADAVCTPDIHPIPAITADHGVTDVTDCTLDLSGVVTVTGNIWIYDIARGSVTGITMTNGSCAFAATGGTYTCTTNTIAGDATWTGGVTFSSNKAVCGTNPLSFTAVAPRSTLSGNDVVIQRNATSCP